MPMSGAEIFAQGLLGGIVGAGRGASQVADTEMKDQMAAVREERLSALRRGDYAEKLKIEQQQKDVETAKRAAFYDRTAPKEVETPGVEVDESGKEIGIIAGLRSENRRETADRRMEEARKTGDTELVKQTYSEAKDIRSDEEQQRKAKSDETKAEAAARLAADRERQTEIRDRDAATREKRADAMIAKALGGGEAGKSPAKIREVKELADMAFGGDVEKAVQFVYGVNDKPRTASVMQMAQLLKSTGDESADDPKKLMAKAEEMVDSLRSKEGATRGGIKVGGGEAPPKADTAPAKPKNKAEFDALPSGALWVDPKTGKTFRKP